MRYADVGWVDVAIDVEVADFSMALLADVICEPAKGEQIARLKERKPIFAGQALLCQNLLRDRFKTAVGNLESRRHVSKLATARISSEKRPALGARHERGSSPEEQEQ